MDKHCPHTYQNDYTTDHGRFSTKQHTFEKNIEQ